MNHPSNPIITYLIGLWGMFVSQLSMENLILFFSLVLVLVRLAKEIYDWRIAIQRQARETERRLKTIEDKVAPSLKNNNSTHSKNQSPRENE